MSDWKPLSLDEHFYNNASTSLDDFRPRSVLKKINDRKENVTFEESPFKLASYLAKEMKSPPLGHTYTANDYLKSEIKETQITEVLRLSGISTKYENKINPAHTIKQNFALDPIDQNSGRPIIMDQSLFASVFEQPKQTQGLSEIEEDLIKMRVSNKNLPFQERFKTLFAETPHSNGMYTYF